MNRKQFGKLITLLRRQQHNSDGTHWTQKQLADAVNATPSIISQIERGLKINLEPRLIQNFMLAFHLNPRERREFLHISTFSRSAYSHDSSNNLSSTYQHCLNILANIALPAFIVDQYDNALAANAILLHLFEYIGGLQPIANQQNFGYNILRFVFADYSPFFNSLKSNRDHYTQQTIAFFRSISLAWRTTTTYQNLLQTLQSDPTMTRFNLAWQKDSLTPNPEYDFEHQPVRLLHEHYGLLKFISPTLFPAQRETGDLYLINYIPLDQPTLTCFTKLSNQYYGHITRLHPLCEETIYTEEEETLTP